MHVVKNPIFKPEEIIGKRAGGCNKEAEMK